MKAGFFNRLIATVLAMVLFTTAAAVYVRADGDEAPGKYVSEVFIAYGKTQDEAVKWLTDNGWEPIKGNNDFNAGKSSGFDDDIAAAMGIKRTDKSSQAITDMAVMNMKGGYSFPYYTDLVNQKKSEITEFINTFIPTIEEYRQNYNGQGSAAGQRRAELTYRMLNKFIDGGPEEKYAVNDTGMRLGDMFLAKLRQEGNNSGGDLQQIVLESSGAAVFAIETALALAADTNEDTWLERLTELSTENIAEHIADYVPEAAGQDLAPSAAMNMLKQKFADPAAVLADQWKDVNEKMLWYEDYNNEHDLWQHDGEPDDEFPARVNKYFDDLEKSDPEKFEEDIEKYTNYGSMYLNLYEIAYSGDWGETLGDFFNPAGGEDYTGNVDAFLPLAAALSDGQRASLEVLALYTLIVIGMGDEATIEGLYPNIEEILAEKEEVSVYSGINRGIFRGGVALTSNALMEKNMGYDPYNDLWSFAGMYNIVCYSMAIVGAIGVISGISLMVAGKVFGPTAEVIREGNRIEGYIIVLKDSIKNSEDIIKSGNYGELKPAEVDADLAQDLKDLKKQEGLLDDLQPELNAGKGMSIAGRVLFCIGGALLIAAAFAKGYQMYQYYNKEFTQIPRMLVDESDIVKYIKDKDGKEVKVIEFDQYVYYDSVKCNRQAVGEISDWVDGVESYAEWGCGDVADLNVDQGQEWLALYTVKSPKKGYPILADSLTLQYGSSSQPDGTSEHLHLMTYTHAMDLGDTAYSYNNDKNGVYFFWDSDEHAYDAPTASTFSGGHMAIAAAGGLIIGLLAATIVLLPRKKKEEQK